MSTPVSAPRWALDHLRNHLDDGDKILNVALVGRNLVLAHTKLGSVVVRKSMWMGITHGTLGYPTNLVSPTRTETAPTYREADISRDWESTPALSTHARTESTDSDAEETADTTATTSAGDGVYREGPYTLYAQQTGGKPRYFFSKGTPAAGSPSPLPPGYIVGRNERTGLPFLKADPDYVPENETPIRRDSTKRYTGDVHKVIDVEGIGKTLAARLNHVGCTDTDELCRFDPAELAAALDLGQRTIEEWQAMAELMKVSGIGKQYAEVLALSGLHGIDDLKGRNATAISRAVNAYVHSQKRKPIGTELTPKRVETWQQTARKMRKSTTTILHPTVPVSATPTAEAIPATTATITPAYIESPGVTIKGPSGKAAAGIDLSGLDPTRGDVSVQWDTAPQMVAERSHKARSEEAPTQIAGKGNEIKVDLRIESRPVAVPSHNTTVSSTSEGTTTTTTGHAPVTPRAAPSLLSTPEGAEVNLAGRRGAARPSHAPVAPNVTATPTATPPPAPVRAVDGTEVQVVKSKGGIVRRLD